MKSDYNGTIVHSAQLLDEWVRDLDKRLDWNDPDRTFRLLKVTLHGVRDMLQIDEAVQLSAQMPLVLKGYYFERWDPSSRRKRKSSDFIKKVRESFSNEELADPKEAIAAVFSELNKRVSSGEIADVRRAMRKPLRKLWPG